ncbi:anaerobic sulfatase maturase [Demequina iriomotensis]|uniref:anaerobic sulfatase maturase n=1 Tax=Demequina iriomotensis TaxID=1536641 RepID=UPI0009E2BE5E|nr:anaerobic sulfatase maturase [Demequina iriomotensis]
MSDSPTPDHPVVVTVPGLDPLTAGGRRRLPFTVLAKPTGAACNLDCTYCFFLSKELLYDGDGQRMTEAGLEAYLANLLRSQPDGEVEIAWQGGEPTMRGLPFFRRAVALAEQLRRPAQTVRHTLQTNGTLLDDAWGEFLAQHGFLIGLSVDGPAHLHDAYRVNKAGRATHAQVMRGLSVLQRHGVDFNILCTVHAANQGHGLEVYRYFRDTLGARHVQFIPIVERVTREQLPIAEQGWKDGNGTRILYRQEGDAVTSRSVDPAAWGAFLTAIFDEWAAHDVGTVYVQHFDIMLGNALGQYSMCVHAPECGGALAVEHTGDVYACDHYVEPGYLLGNVAERSLQSMLQSPAQRAFGEAKRSTLPQQCRECPVRWACHGGCPKDRFDRTADGEPGLNHLCAGYLRFFSHAEPTIRRMAEVVGPTLG